VYVVRRVVAERHGLGNDLRQSGLDDGSGFLAISIWLGARQPASKKGFRGHKKPCPDRFLWLQKPMEIDPPDPAKETINRGKHGISLWDAALMDFTTATVALDTRFAYSEDQYRGWGLIDDVLHVPGSRCEGKSCGLSPMPGQPNGGPTIWQELS
jgi:hypothetical protein